MKNDTKLYKKVIPFIIAGGLTFGTGTYLGYTPFYSDKNTIQENSMKEIFPDGNVKTTYVGSNTNIDNFVKNYSAWKKTDEGKYKREVDYYFFESYNKEELQKAKEQLKELEPSLTTEEESSSLTDEELKDNKPFTTVVFFDEENKIVEETKLDNALSTGAEIAIFLLLSLGINEIRLRRVRKK